MAEAIQPDAVMRAPTDSELRLQLLNIDYRVRFQQAVTTAALSAPLAIYGFAANKTWAKTVGVLGLLSAAWAYFDATRRAGPERDAAARGLVLS